MMSAQRVCGSVLVAGAISMTTATVAQACVMPNPTPPPKLWITNHGDTDADGDTNFWVGIEVSLFTTTSPTGCACGIGFAQALPVGLAAVDGSHVSITNTLTHEERPLTDDGTPSGNPIFDNFGANGNTSSDLSNLDPGGNLDWNGFVGAQPSVPPQQLGPNEVIKLWFDLDVDPTAIRLLQGNSVVFASGEGDPTTGNVPPTGEHAPQFYTSQDGGSLQGLPEPTSLALLALGGIAVLRRR